MNLYFTRKFTHFFMFHYVRLMFCLAGPANDPVFFG